jgi:hypothetical protein
MTKLGILDRLSEVSGLLLVKSRTKKIDYKKRIDSPLGSKFIFQD